MSVKKYLNYGEKNAIHADDLARLLNIDTRDLRKDIDRERIEGVPILSSHKGYFLPDRENGEQELKVFIARFQKRRNTANKIIKMAFKTLDRIEKEKK